MSHPCGFFSRNSVYVGNGACNSCGEGLMSPRDGKALLASLCPLFMESALRSAGGKIEVRRGLWVHKVAAGP